MAVEHTRDGRDNTLDFLRLFAASIVVVAHSQADFHTSFLWDSSQLFDGVGMFFIMSGMLVYRSAESTWARTGRFRDFLWNRYLRVAPGIYAFALLAPIVLVVAGAVSFQSLFEPWLFVWLGSALFLLPNYDPQVWEHVGTGVINGQLYTIPAEVSFYLIVPLLVLAARRFTFMRMLAVFVLFSLAVGFFAALSGDVTAAIVHHTFIERAGFFAAGMFWAKYRDRIPANWWLFFAACAVYIPLKLVSLNYHAFGPAAPIVIAVPLSYMVVFFGYHGPRVLGRWTSRVGDLSYSTYIWHVLVINLLLWAGFSKSWWLVLVVLFVTWGIAWASWRVVERPALRLKRVSSRKTADPKSATV